MYRTVKPILDGCLAAVATLMFSPVMVLIAIAIRIHMGPGVFFKQRRPGYKGIPFTFYKFRTMKNSCDGQGKLLPDAMRITVLGQFLRKTSLDELPELFHVLRGQMSMVGPRPLLMEYLPRYSSEQFRRHDVLPGITGWAQVNGRNAISWDKKFQLDVWYVDNRSLILDIKILVMTLFRVLRRSGIHQQGHATSEKFRGNDNG